MATIRISDDEARELFDFDFSDEEQTEPMIMLTPNQRKDAQRSVSAFIHAAGRVARGTVHETHDVIELTESDLIEVTA